VSVSKISHVFFDYILNDNHLAVSPASAVRWIITKHPSTGKGLTMKIYCGIDLHSNNTVVALTDENDQVVYQRRLRNELELILKEIEPYKESIQGIVVESTYNWYWLVDGLKEAGHTVHLANIAEMQQYSGLKYTDDNHDARWLAHMLRIGVLAEG
jgi:transposase